MEVSGMKLSYQSTLRGVTQRKLESEDIVYIGVLQRIPMQDIPDKIAENELAFNLAQLFEDQYLDGELYEFYPEGVFERVDIREQRTGDIVAMWRVPFRQKIILNLE